MQQQSNMQNKFLIDADIGDDDVTLPSLPAVDVPIVEPVQQQTPVEAPIAAVEEVSSPAVQEEAKSGFFGRMKDGLTKTRQIGRAHV